MRTFGNFMLSSMKIISRLCQKLLVRIWEESKLFEVKKIIAIDNNNAFAISDSIDRRSYYSPLQLLLNKNYKNTLSLIHAHAWRKKNHHNINYAVKELQEVMYHFIQRFLITLINIFKSCILRYCRSVKQF